MSTRPYLRPTARQQRALDRRRRRSAQDVPPRTPWHSWGSGPEFSLLEFIDTITNQYRTDPDERP